MATTAPKLQIYDVVIYNTEAKEFYKLQMWARSTEEAHNRILAEADPDLNASSGRLMGSSKLQIVSMAPIGNTKVSPISETAFVNSLIAAMEDSI